MDPLTHLIAAGTFVGTLTAMVVLGVRAVQDGLDRLAYRRAIRRRLSTFGR